MKELSLTQGKVALVSDEDFDELNKYKWTAHCSKNKWYAYRCKRINGKQTTIYLHRQIMNPFPTQHVDHIDNDGLNCQRNNLRLCNQSQNMRNMNTENKNHFKGVGKAAKSNSYTAQIHINGTKKHLGSFRTAKEAAIAYNIAAILYFGEFACLNNVE